MSSPWYVKPFVRLLRTSDTVEEIVRADPAIVFVASYSAKCRGELSRATWTNLHEASSLWEKIPRHPLLAWGACSHAFPGAEQVEHEMKHNWAHVKGVPYVYLGPIANSIDEMLALKRIVAEKGIDAKKILIVTCELHSGSERLLAQMLFPDAQVMVYANPHDVEVERGHPTRDQRSWPRWLWCSVLRYYAFKAASKGWVSLDWLRKRQHAPGAVLAT